MFRKSHLMLLLAPKRSLFSIYHPCHWFLFQSRALPPCAMLCVYDKPPPRWLSSVALPYNCAHVLRALWGMPPGCLLPVVSNTLLKWEISIPTEKVIVWGFVCLGFFFPSMLCGTQRDLGRDLQGWECASWVWNKAPCEGCSYSAWACTGSLLEHFAVMLLGFRCLKPLVLRPAFCLEGHYFWLLSDSNWRQWPLTMLSFLQLPGPTTQTLVFHVQ